MDVDHLGEYFGRFAVTEVEAATPTRALGDRAVLSTWLFPICNTFQLYVTRANVSHRLPYCFVAAAN